MGNKRKASLIVLTVIFAAVMVFSCVPFLFVSKTMNVSAANATQTTSSDGNLITLSGTSSYNYTDIFDVTVTPGAVYAIIFTGENGEGKFENWNSYAKAREGGYGATCLAFYSTGTDSKKSNWYVGSGGGTGLYAGGGYTEAYSNFALPKGQDAGWARAGGGGGGFWMKHAKIASTPSTEYIHAYFSGASDLNTSTVRYEGSPGTSTNDGYQGRDADYDPVYTRSINGCSIKSIDEGADNSSGGGAGRTDGGGGGDNRKTNYADRTAYPGGGGTSSYNAYPIYAKDAVLGISNEASYGAVNLYRIDPIGGSLPIAKNTNNVSDATITAGSGGYYEMSDLYLNSYVNATWVYYDPSKGDITKSSSWTTDASAVKNTVAGTTEEIVCRYVVYATGDRSTLTPAYNMQYDDPCDAAAAGGAGNASGKGYVVKEARLKITKKGYAEVATAPTAKTVTYNGSAQELINAGNHGAHAKEMQYKLGDNGTWTADATAIKATNYGTYTVYYKAVTNDSTLYVDSEVESISVTISKADPGLSPGTLANKSLTYQDKSVLNEETQGFTKIGRITFTGVKQYLFSGDVAWKDNKGISTTGTTYYTMTTNQTTPDSSVEGTNTISGIFAADAGTYYLWSRVTEGDNHNAKGWTAVKIDGKHVSTTIAKATPRFYPYQVSYRKSALADGAFNFSCISAYEDLVYNGTPQKLYTASTGCCMTNAGAVNFGISTGTAPTEMGVEAVNAADDKGNILTYHLWYSIPETKNTLAVDWTKVRLADPNIEFGEYKDGCGWYQTGDLLTDMDRYMGYRAAINQIDKARLTVSATLMSDMELNGTQVYRLIPSEPTIVCNTSLQDDFKVTYRSDSTFAGGAYVNYGFSEDYTKIIAYCAGLHEISASWEPIDSITDALTRAQYQSVSEHPLGTVTISQISDTGKIGFSGVTLKDTSLLRLDNTGKNYPFATAAVDLSQCGLEGGAYGITSNPYKTNAEPFDPNEDVNIISFCLTQSIEAPTDDSAYTRTYTKEELNQKILETYANKQGNWYLYIRIDRHFNIVSGTIKRVMQFEVDGYNVLSTDLNGITMAPTLIYDGNEHSVVADGVLGVNLTGIELGDVQYVVSQYYSAPQSGWVDNINDLFQPTEAGTYNLFVKWTASDTVEANQSGYLYGSFMISQHTDLDAYYFSGNDFAGWTLDNADESFNYYSITYDNSLHHFGSFEAFKTDPVGEYPVEVGVIDYPQIATAQFGSFYFALGDLYKPTSSYYTVEYFQQGLQVQDVGDYYLWIKWDGGNNIASGEKLYCSMTDGKVLDAIFQVKKLKDNSTVELADENFAYSKGEVGYQFIFKQYATEGYAVGVEQPLFEEVTTPSIKINDALYAEFGVTYQYLLAEVDEVITENSLGWQNKIANAKATNVGEYNLWILITIENPNVSIARAVMFTSDTAVISPSDAFARMAPTARNNLETNGVDALQLIDPSLQTNPLVEYVVVGMDEELTGEEVWTTDATAITKIDAGKYKVFYRGAETRNDLGRIVFKTQGEPVGGYSFIRVVIEPANPDFKIKPIALKNVIYTGNELITFEKGYAEPLNPGDSPLELLYSWENEPNTWFSYDGLPKKTDAGIYNLYYKVDDTHPNFATALPYVIQVQIFKADIKIVVENETWLSSLAYKGANYGLLFKELNFAMVDSEGETLIKDANQLTYYQSKINGWEAGKMGKIYYAVSNSSTIVPANEEWVANYQDVFARVAGNYYIWAKVDESGKNHNGLAAYCCNPENPITITPVDYENQGYVNVFASSSSFEVVSDLRYNGVKQALIRNLTLGIKVADRNERGEIIFQNGQMQFNVVTNLAEIGTVYYALSDSQEFPAVDDFSANGWQRNYQTLSKIEAGKYYLMVMLCGDSCFSQMCFNLSLDQEVVGEEIKIAPAAYEDLEFVGVVALTKMYNGNLQTMASGSLTARIKNIRYNLAGQYTPKFCYVKSGSFAPDETADWTDLADAKVMSVSEYQLYVYLQNTSSNIDAATTPLIYPLFEDHYAQITPVSANRIDIVAPGLANNLVYNGLPQTLVTSSANIVMKDGSVLDGQLGVATYYISSKFATIDGTGTTNGGLEKKHALAELKEVHAGTYYIWVEFAAGDSHDKISPVCVGSVTINQANGNHVVLSGIQFGRNTYNGEYHSLVFNGGIKHTFINGEHVLNASDYAKIEYAYSSDANIRPSDDAWVEDITLLTARNAGKYYIWVSVTGKPNTENGQNNITDYIKCYANEETDYAQIGQAILEESNFDGITFNQNLVYIAESQVLATIQDKLIIRLKSEDLNTAEHNSDLNVYWALGQNAEDAPSTGWFNRIEDLQGINSQKYYIWVWVQECKNFEEIQIYLGCVEIAKGTIVFDNQSIGNNLTYNGSYQELLSAGRSIQFYAPGYAQEYYNINGIEIQYQNSTLAGAWSTNYRDVKGLNATTFTVRYQVPETDNWKLAEDEIQVTIKPADASTNYIGLVEAPTAKLSLFYNEQEQELISYGVLSSVLGEPGCGAALEGVKIVFYYESDPQKTEYKYYYDQVSSTYKWENDQPLPGKVNAGTYCIKYYLSASTFTENFETSDLKEVYITINKRPIYWVIKPESVYSFKYITGEHQILMPGQLNVDITNPSTAAGVKIKYTLDAPGGQRFWQDNIPMAASPKIWPVWYYVWVDENNVFIGDEDNDPVSGTRIDVLIEPNVLTIIQAPTSRTLQYTAEDQLLVESYYLSTDATDIFGNKAPYIEFSFDKNGDDSKWSTAIKAKDVGEYTVYYRLRYDENLFEFRGENDGRTEPMEITVVIEKMTIRENSIRAVYDAENNLVSYEIGDYQVYDDEKGEWKLVPMYSEAMMDQIEPSIQYYYRKSDGYMVGGWQAWINDSTQLSGLGTYEFMLNVVPNKNAVLNFNAYSQGDDDCDSFTLYEDRVVNIVMQEQEYTTPAYIRAWIAFTPDMKYEDSEFVYESWVDKNGKLEIPFYDVDSAGSNNGAVIKLQIINANYYYMSQDALSTEKKLQIDLTSEEINSAKSFNVGLHEPRIFVYLYEIYNIKYDANGGTGEQLNDGWKWHNIDYLLSENNYTKNENGNILSANGWNTSKTGSGDNYSSGAMYYRENVSRVFYAKFFTKGENVYTVNWIVSNGRKTYALDRDTHIWFDISLPENQTRNTGMLVAEGALITLPQVQLAENNKSLSSIFAGYILGWSSNEGEYSIDMKATKNITFTADLNNDLNNYVACKFVNAENEEVHDSGLVANGAKAYMALSGMDASLINSYEDGYKKWIQDYGATTLNGSNTPDGILTYELGVKSVVQDPEDEKQTSIAWEDYTVMFIVVGVGAAGVMILLGVYIVFRKKQKPSNNSLL